jgi:hypothetical protein
MEIGYSESMAQFGFDTLAFVKRLSAAGMDTRHAEALAEALNDNAFSSLATKEDLREVRSELREMELRLTNNLTVRMGAMTAATIAILGALDIFS